MFDSKKWQINEYDETIINDLKGQLGISRVCSILLYNRGYKDIELAKNFLSRSDASLYNPFNLQDMDKAVERIIYAIKKHEKITIYGDYDADGITSTAILYLYLKDYVENIDYYIPSREKDGYGINIEAIKKIKQNQTNLIVTVDNGSTAIEEIDYANSLGIDVIVTDHHKCLNELPKAIAVVNPCRNDEIYPFKNLAGVGVAFKLICAIELFQKNNSIYNLETIKLMSIRFLDLVAIGTIADVMPLVSENRIYVYLGLILISDSRNPGINRLLYKLNLNNKTIDSTTIAYQIAPKINACGRLNREDVGIELFISSDFNRIDYLVDELLEINKKRQQLEEIIFKDAKLLIEHYNLNENSVIVIYSEKWEAGVLGVVASKIVDLYNKPAVLISFKDDQEIGKGSARSTINTNLYELLSNSSEYLERFGGHETAAGLSIKKENVKLFSKKLNELINNDVLEDEIQFVVDCELLQNELSVETIKSYNNMEPFGVDNTTPLFALRNVQILEMHTIGNGKHSKFIIYANNNYVECIMFSHNIEKNGFRIGDEVDLIFNMNNVTYKNKTNLNLYVRDIDYCINTKNTIEKYQKLLNNIAIGNSYISKNQIPIRQDFVEIYINLKNMLNDGEKVITIKKIINTLNEDNYIRTGIALIAMKEVGILNIDYLNNIEFRISINDIEKTNIFNATIFKKLMVK